MSLGDVLLVLAALAALAAFATGAIGLRRDDLRVAAISRYAVLAAFAAVSAALLLLVAAFLTTDLSYAYVWSHSSSGLDPFYKLVGTWAGGEGGLVLWTWFMALFLAAEVLADRRIKAGPRYSAAFRMAGSSIVLLFSLILLAAGLFEPTGQAELLLHPDGLGMNLALQTMEMAIHPPLVFAAYAACLVLFSASLARSLTADEGWSPIALRWARLAGLLLIAGIAVGAVWAYYELGWGGFWVWDPVETASLLPLIAVIAFLHANRSPGARNGALQPFLGMLALVLALLASFITRTGGLWGSSVHTYGSTVSGTIGTRFITVLTGDMSVMGLFTVIAVLFALSVVLSYRTMARVGEQGRVEPGVLATVALLLMYAVLLLLLLVKNTGLDQGANFVEFTEKTTLLSAAMAILLFFGLIVGLAGTRRAARASAAVAFAAVILAAVAAVTGALPWLVALSLPTAGAVMAASVYRIAALGRGSLSDRLGRAGGHVVHLGIALILVSFIVSSTMQAYLPQPASLDVGTGITVGGHEVELRELTVGPWTSTAGEAGEVRTAVFAVLSNGGERMVTVSNFYQDDGSGLTLVRSGTGIVNGLTEDVYLSFEWTDNDTATVQVRVLPMVSVVWIGFGVATLGMAATLLGGRRETPGELF